VGFSEANDYPTKSNQVHASLAKVNGYPTKDRSVGLSEANGDPTKSNQVHASLAKANDPSQKVNQVHTLFSESPTAIR
jgi:hypothetical protein